MRRAVSFSFIALAWFALSPTVPAADGGLPNQNTAEGKGALSSLTTGANNTAIGFNALHSLATGSEATATGSLALANDTFGFNTAYGFNALYSSTTGFANTALGRNALFSHVTGDHNTATGGAALFLNADGTGNTATGRAALANGTTGSANTATGWQTLFNNTGDNNAADGAFALFSNTTGSNNAAFGYRTLVSNTTGHSNIALGTNAGAELTTGNNNIDIGNFGNAGESGKIRIGTVGTHKNAFIAGISGTTIAGGVTVIVGTDGHLGTVTSSERFKDQIKPMENVSEAIFSLKPVTFRYKHDLDPEGISQFGLVAEQVAKVNPALVARDAQGKVYTVRYEAVNAMLLNEFLKEHRNVQKLQATVAQQQKDFQSTVAQQQKEIKALTSSLREQASQIQKVSDRLEMSEPAPRVVVNNQ